MLMDAQKGRRLIVAAHFDSKYFAPPNDQFVGATDRAFPWAVLLNLAESLDGMLESRISQLESDTVDIEDDQDLADTTLQLLFFDGEEAFVSCTNTDSIYGARPLAETRESTYVSSESPSVVTSLSSRSNTSSFQDDDDDANASRPPNILYFDGSSAVCHTDTTRRTIVRASLLRPQDIPPLVPRPHPHPTSFPLSDTVDTDLLLEFVLE
ncbi:hypothetical protein EV360DRAFT_91144 [Lentinula raphanica]|nr:hypothetical protein EV360DRAFT_91144 [Lentinula raphanica]